ncbi:MAG: hypothetical protein ACFB20_01545 [Opitutales bacterium]
MQNFADQCLDIAASILGQNLDAINEDGTLTPTQGEASRLDEPGHVALAIGEYYRATQKTELAGHDLVDLTARCVTAQAFAQEEAENGLAYSALGLLSFGPAKDRNAVWERLLDETREELDRRLLARTDYDNHLQAFNVAKAVARFSMGLSKKDETGKLVDTFLERIRENSSAGFVDDGPEGFGGVFDIYGVLSFIFIRQALQLHANIHLRERKLPSLRTHAEKYIKMIPDIVRSDGLGWCYGRGIGAYGQMHCISIVLQAMRDGWFTNEQKEKYTDLFRRLFYFFFATYIDQEQGFIVIRDNERTTGSNHTTRMANFDAARYLCQWSRLARAIGGEMSVTTAPGKTTTRFVIFDKSHRKEQGLFIYQDAGSGLHVQIPLVSQGGQDVSDSLAFPHSPGIFDWPVGRYVPIMVPELTFGEHRVVPCFYGKRCVTGMGLRKSFYFRYEQPDLITTKEKMLSNVGSCKVNWTFSGKKVTSEYVFTVKNQVQMDHMRYVVALAEPHSRFRFATTFKAGPDSLGISVVRDDFQAVWAQPEPVTEDESYRTYYGNVHYLQVLRRDHPLIMRPGQQYRLTVTFDPDIVFADE